MRDVGVTGRAALLRRRVDGGFTLIEVLLASAMVAVLGAVLLSMYLGYAHVAQRAETLRRLQIVRDGFGAFYRRQAFLVETESGATFRTGEATRIASGTLLQDADLRPIEAFLPRYAPGDSHRDGYGQPIRVWISNRRFQSVDGIAIAYRRVAFVSAGPNGRFESNDWDPEQAYLTRVGDDEVLILDAWGDQADLFRRTDERMQRLAEAIRSYAQGRYLLDPNRDPLIDYFGRSISTDGSDASGASDRFDPGSALVRTSTKPDGALTDAEIAALQLSRDDVTGAWGQPLRLENDTELVRSPDRAPPDNFPPYTARIVATLPGRGEYQHLIIGAF